MDTAGLFLGRGLHVLEVATVVLFGHFTVVGALDRMLGNPGSVKRGMCGTMRLLVDALPAAQAGMSES